MAAAEVGARADAFFAALAASAERVEGGAT
jgi:hypothetical protein